MVFQKIPLAVPSSSCCLWSFDFSTFPPTSCCLLVSQQELRQRLRHALADLLDINLSSTFFKAGIQSHHPALELTWWVMTRNLGLRISDRPAHCLSNTMVKCWKSSDKIGACIIGKRPWRLFCWTWTTEYYFSLRLCFPVDGVFFRISQFRVCCSSC